MSESGETPDEIGQENNVVEPQPNKKSDDVGIVRTGSDRTSDNRDHIGKSISLFRGLDNKDLYGQNEKYTSEDIFNLSPFEFSEYVKSLEGHEYSEVVSKLPIIFSKLKRDAPDKISIENEESVGFIAEASALERYMEYLAEFQDRVVDPEILRQVQMGYQNSEHQDNYAIYVIDNVIAQSVRIDEQNREFDEDSYLNIQSGVVEGLMDTLLNAKNDFNFPQSNEEYKCQVVLNQLGLYYKEMLPDFLRKFVERMDDNTHLNNIGEVVDIIGIAGTRNVLREMTVENSQIKDKTDKLLDYYGGLAGEKKYHKLEELYEDIHFENYKPNEELIGFEAELLLKELGTGMRAIDVACGVGRHMEKLAERGVDVVGIDLVEEHIRKIQEEHPEFDVRQGSWFELPFQLKSESFLYCLGRSFLHNTTLEDGARFFAEMERVLTDDGSLVVDFPDPNSEEYREKRRKFYEAEKELELDRFSTGVAIHDSPDGERFFDRIAPVDVQIKAMAALSDLEAEKIFDQSYEGIEGSQNVNSYWRFRRREIPYTAEELFEIEKECMKVNQEELKKESGIVIRLPMGFASLMFDRI